MSEKRPYRTTAFAGFFVAGQRVPSRFDEDGNRVPVVGHPLMLTEAEARYELLQLTIEPAGEGEAAPLSPPEAKGKRGKAD